LEALCAGNATGSRYPWKEVGLAPWAKQKLKEEGHIRGIPDQGISSTIGRKSLERFTEIVMACLKKKRMERPSMEQVIAQLEIALELQSSHPCSDSSDDDSLLWLLPTYDDSSDDSSDDGSPGRARKSYFDTSG
jgi:hypothetical protein